MDRLFEKFLPGPCGGGLTDYEALNLLFGARGVDYVVSTTSDGGRGIYLEVGSRHSWEFLFDAAGKLTSTQADCL